VDCVHQAVVLDLQRTPRNIVAYLLTTRTVKPERQPLLGNGCITRNNGVTVGSGVFCAVFTEAIYNEDQVPLRESL
jgi:hypothetical protein